MAATGQSGERVLRRDAERTAAALPPLLVAAERIASTVVLGVHGRRRVGSGETFWQFRRYQQGDTVQSIDWRRSARSDRLYIREHEWEAAQTVWLWCDGSPSMDFASGDEALTKSARSRVLALALAILLSRGGEHVGLFGADAAATGGRAAVNRLTSHLAAERTGSAPSLPPRGRLPRFSHFILFSDFLSPLDEIEQLVRHYAGQGVTGHLVQVLDPAEEDLPYHGRSVFVGLEAEESYLASRVETLRPAYVRRMAARREALSRMVRQVGWTTTFHRTDRPAQSALLAVFSALGGMRD
jgi:uncharacterized protein (DUF58 family)